MYKIQTNMKTFELSQNNYNALRIGLAGFVFHRIDDAGRYLMKPLKRVESIVAKFAIKEIEKCYPE